MNGVSTTCSGDTSPGMDCHVQQVMPDCHQISLQQIKTKDWNMECENYERERKIGECEGRNGEINILGINEMRWTGAGKM